MRASIANNQVLSYFVLSRHTSLEVRISIATITQSSMSLKNPFAVTNQNYSLITSSK